MKQPTATLKNNLIGGVRWSRLSPFVLFLLLLFAPATESLFGQSTGEGLEDVRVKLVNGSSIRASISNVDRSGKIEGSQLLQDVALDEIISIETGRSAVAVEELPFLRMQSGGHQPFTELRLDEDTATIKSANNSSRRFALELVEAIVFVESESVNRALQNRTSENDAVVVNTSSGEKVVPGLVEAIDETHVVLNYNGKSRRIGLPKVRAVVLARLETRKPQGFSARVSLIDGSTWVGAIDSMTNQKLDFSLSSSHRFEINCSEIQQLVIQTDRMVYLSDLSPIRQEQQTQFVAARPWQRDRSLLGNPIQLKFASRNKTVTFDKGLGTRSFTSLVYPNDGFNIFHAVAGIDAETGGKGDCEMVVSGDGIRLWSQRIRASEDPQMIKVDITGINEITLEVYPGEQFDLADHADWADARFTKN